MTQSVFERTEQKLFERDDVYLRACVERFLDSGKRREVWFNWLWYPKRTPTQ